MSSPARGFAGRRPAFALAIASLALVGGGALLSSPSPATPAPNVPTLPPAAAPAADGAGALPTALDPIFLEIATVARERGFAAARARLEPLAAADDGERARFAALYLGLLAHANEDPALAVERLRAAVGPRELDDWRLYVLADSTAARRDAAGATRALELLIESHPDSPLRPDAIVRLAALAAERGDAATTQSRILRARAERLPRARAIELELLAWKVATASGNAEAMRAAARRLLVLDPLEASKLRVVDAVAASGGGSDWRLWLSAEELVARAEALLEVDLPAGAQTTLAAVPVAARDLAWHRLEARTLVASGRAAEGYARLASLAPLAADDPALEAAIEDERARAAAVAAEPTRGRPVTFDERATWRRLERERLLAVVRLAAVAPERERPALRRLAASYLEDSRRPEAVAALRQLSALDPADSSMARPLWELGWRSYRAGGTSGNRDAVSTWDDLAALYPASSWARGGIYWTARALERQGDRDGARARFLALAAAATPDFYARQAALRLAGATATAPEAPLQERWPEDRELARARRLTDLALDGLATRELELVGERAEPRAKAALTALAFARAGDRRASLRQLKRAFPQLGTAAQGSAPPEAFALYYPLDYRLAISRAAAAEGLPPSLVFGMVHQESGFDATATSHAGARGLMQLMPATGREVAEEARPAVLVGAALRARLQPAARHQLLPPHAGAVRRQRGARARRLQRRTGPDLAALGGGGLERRARPFPRGARARGASQLRQTHRRPGGELPESLSRPRLTLRRRCGEPSGPGAHGPRPTPGP